MRHLAKFLLLSRRDKKLLFEAFAFLLLSHLSIKAIPFSRIYEFLGARWQVQAPSDNDHTGEIRLVDLSLVRAANRLPFKSLCLSRSISAFIMLRRRGIPAVLFAGAKLEDSSLVAHAWVRVADRFIDANPENDTFAAVMSIGAESASR